VNIPILVKKNVRAWVQLFAKAPRLCTSIVPQGWLESDYIAVLRYCLTYCCIGGAWLGHREGLNTLEAQNLANRGEPE
jgi:hypothetical protein